MNAVQLEHPSGTMLTAYGLGQLCEEELADIDNHLANCDVCRQVVEGVVPDTLLALLRSAATEPDSIEANSVPPESHTPTPPDALPTALVIEHPRYRIGTLLGVGGMGAVYKAEHLLMERPVALKVLNRELIDKPATIERFRREVRAAARLTHPNIVAAFDAEQAGDVHFLAMEYVEGVSLARHSAERGALAVAEACDYVRQAALGLEHAHQCGMVHRDIKPQNLMLTPGGQVKILDFGLARFVMESVPAGALLAAEGEPASAPSGASVAKPLTQIGIVMGTPDYIAPEQATDSHLADIRADIYSLGCTLYHLLAGHAPFPEGNALQKVKAHLGRTPRPLKDLRPDVLPDLIRVVERMMAKDPAQRFQTPAEVAAALEPFMATPPKPPRRNKWLLVTAALGLAAVLVAGVVIYVQTDRGRIIIETNDDKIAVMIHKAGGVKIVDQATKREYLLQPGARDLPSGDYQIEVTDELGGLDFQVKKFELKRGKEVRLTARFVADGDGQARRPGAEADRTRAKERLQILKEIASQRQAQYENGAGMFDKLLEAKREVAKAELELCESNKERIKVHETLVGLARSLADLREVQSSNARIPRVDALQAKADLLEAETALERAKTRAQAETSRDQGPLYRGKPAAFWLDQLQDADPKFRAEAVEALGSIAQKNKGLIPVLVDSLSDKDEQVGENATAVLASLGKDVVPTLAERMKDQTSVTALHRAVIVVSEIGPDAKAAVPLLARALKSEPIPVPVTGMVSSRPPKPPIWRSAINALWQIGPEARPAIPTMIEVLGDYLESVKLVNQRVPMRTKKGGKATPIYFGPSSFPASFGRALAKIDPEARDLLPSEESQEGTREELLTLWQKAYDALKKKYAAQKPADRPGEKATKGTVGDASNSDKKDQGPLYRGKPASYWMSQSKDADPKFRAEAVDALGFFAKKNKEIVPLLVAYLKDEDYSVSRQAAMALGYLGPEVLPLLLELLKDKTSPATVSRAAQAVHYMGPPAKAAVPLLSEALKINDWQVRRIVIIALHSIGPEAKPALPAMVDCLGSFIKEKGKASDNWQEAQDFGLMFGLALLKIDPEVQKLVPKIQINQLRNDGWQEVYDALKKKYPKKPTPSPDSQPTEGAAGEAAAKSKLDKKDQGPFYRGKPVSFWTGQFNDADPKFRAESLSRTVGSYANAWSRQSPVHGAFRAAV